ncbi:MAG: asparagine synthase (glutamine-hydrolyzing) [Microthrixaceae bacterium]
MCGIVGILDPRAVRSDQDSEALLGSMALRMMDRGPDASGTWVDQNAGIGLGHRRLSILDLSDAGAQPMISKDGRWVITYNGEIYDHDQLRVDLEKNGVSPRGHSDTELLVEAIALWGLASTLERIDGMYALGLWDRQWRTLTLVRDRMGEKPIYYGTLDNGDVVFASTLDAIAAHPAFVPDIDRDALSLFFRYKYIPAPWSIYKGIKKLEPGNLVEISSDGTVGEPRAYWSYFDLLARPAFSGTAYDVVDELEFLLRRSVRRRMVADVPLGAFLSGGIDSSVVVALAQQESSTPIHTFTIGSTDKTYDESNDARLTARHLGTRHDELTVTDVDVMKVIGQLGAIYDEPFADSSQIPTRLVSELARRDVTVALSGDGGDELFAGYNRYVWVPAICRRLERIPVPLRSTLGNIGERVPPRWWDRAGRAIPSSRRPRMLGLKVSKVMGVTSAESPYEVFNRLVSHWPEPNRIVLGAREPMTVHSDASRWPNVEGIAEHMSAVDMITYLPDDILVKVDRAAMSVSLETRVPLLDRSIVELAASVPISMKIRDGQSKWPLRELLSRYVPRDLFERPKAGFGIPLDSWLRGPLKSWAEDHLFGSAASEMLDSDLLRQTWKDLQSGRRNEEYKIWDAVMFSAWCEERGIRPSIESDG